MAVAACVAVSKADRAAGPRSVGQSPSATEGRRVFAATEAASPCRPKPCQADSSPPNLLLWPSHQLKEDCKRWLHCQHPLMWGRGVRTSKVSQRQPWHARSCRSLPCPKQYPATSAAVKPAGCAATCPLLRDCRGTAATPPKAVPGTRSTGPAQCRPMSLCTAAGVARCPLRSGRTATAGPHEVAAAAAAAETYCGDWSS